MGDVNKKDLYVQLKLKAIRNGGVFNTADLDYSFQSEVSYTMMEKGLMELLAKWGDDVIGAVQTIPEEPAKPARR